MMDILFYTTIIVVALALIPYQIERIGIELEKVIRGYYEKRRG